MRKDDLLFAIETLVLLLVIAAALALAMLSVGGDHDDRQPIRAPSPSLSGVATSRAPSGLGMAPTRAG